MSVEKKTSKYSMIFIKVYKCVGAFLYLTSVCFFIGRSKRMCDRRDNFRKILEKHAYEVI